MMKTLALSLDMGGVETEADLRRTIRLRFDIRACAANNCDRVHHG